MREPPWLVYVTTFCPPAELTAFNVCVQLLAEGIAGAVSKTKPGGEVGQEISTVFVVVRLMERFGAGLKLRFKL